MMIDFQPGFLLNAILYALLGIVLFAVSFAVLGRMVPFSLWTEIVEKQNVALALLVGAISIGMCIIIAAAVH